MEMPVEHRSLRDSRRSSWVRRLALAVSALGGLLTVLVLATVVQAAPAQQILPIVVEVTSVADTDGSCSLYECTLRQAINTVNLNLSPSPSTIQFNLAGAGPQVVLPKTPLPRIDYPVIIKGANLAPDGGPIVLDGQDSVPAADGLVLDAYYSEVYALTIRNFGGAGIYVNPFRSGIVLSGNTIENNQGNGIHIDSDSDGGGIEVLENVIRNNGGSGLFIDSSFGNLVYGNQIYGNAGDGVTVVGNASYHIQITQNDIHDNGDQPIDLNDDGATENDLGDPDTGANDTQNYPVLVRARPISGGAVVEGYLNSISGDEYGIELFGGAKCGQGSQTFLPSVPYTISLPTGTGFFSVTVTRPVALGTAIQATATRGPFIGSSETSEMSDCVIVGPDNDSWPKALRVNVPASAAAISAAEAEEVVEAAGVTAVDATTGVVTVTQYIDSLGQSRWYKFKIRPNSQLIVTLTGLPGAGLPANYDLTLYKDIEQEYQKLANPQDAKDLTRLQAESAPSSFAPSSFAPSSFAPSSFAPSSFAPSSFAPSSFAPSSFAPSSFAASAFAPAAYSPDSYGSSSFGPWAFDQDAFNAAGFDPTTAYNPSTFDPKSFTGAQTRSLVGVSAYEGTSEEGLIMNTWLNDGDFYVRVRGRDGAFSLAAPFALTVQLEPGPCANAFDTPLPATSLAPQAGGFKSIILVDSARLKAAYGQAQFNQLLVKLDALKLRPEVQGTVVDVSTDARVAAANQRADQYYVCPYGKNVVAESIKVIVDAYRGVNPLEYVVIVGGDNSIPFFRYPDNALIGPESDYFPPVLDPTASQAGLRLNFVLSQDGYGASEFLSLNGTDFPVPGLAVGRLVETPGDIQKQLDAYFQTVNGVAPLPQAALVTGYDFMEDVAQAVKGELATALGAGKTIDTLITPNTVSPLDPQSWTAFELDQKLQSRRYDLVFLAGHFAADNALAADFATALLPTDILSSTVDMRNALFYSMGCHSGYNVVNEHRIPNVTSEQDWASVFAEKGVTWIGGTGFQYGDTEFIEYSERLYLDFTRNLRYEDPGDPPGAPVAIGKALVRAKQRYLAQTPAMKGIHEKSLLIPTIYGLPMFSIDFQGAVWTSAARASLFTSAPPLVTGLPGSALQMRQTDITVTPVTTETLKTLKDADTGQPVVASYLRGRDGALTNPSEPTLPLEGVNLSAPDNALRGVGFRGGDFCDVPNVIPLTGAPATEIRGVYTPFYSKTWFPLQPWSVNYYDVLGQGPGAWGTRLYVMPAQHRSTGLGTLTSIRRQFSEMVFRLFYSANTATFAVGGANESTPALADAPTIVNVDATPDVNTPGVLNFEARVVGNPAAGVHAVWVTWTRSGAACGQWQSLDLVQGSDDTTKWRGALDLAALGLTRKDVRFIVQAVNGVGVVGLSNNMGRYYGDAGSLESQSLPTTLTLEPLVATVGAFSTPTTFAAALRDGSNNPVGGRSVIIGVGSQERFAVTDAAGRAAVTMPLLLQPGDYRVRASFDGDEQYAPSSASSPNSFTVTRQGTEIQMGPVVAASAAAVADSAASQFKATLFDAAGVRLLAQSVFFEFSGGGQVIIRPVQTNLVGEALVTVPALPPGAYTLRVKFIGTDSYLPAIVTFAVKPSRSLYLPFIQR